MARNVTPAILIGIMIINTGEAFHMHGKVGRRGGPIRHHQWGEGERVVGGGGDAAMPSEQMPFGANRKLEKVTILGGGSFGLAMGFVMARNNMKCKILVRKEEVAESINLNRKSPTYLSDFSIPANIEATVDPEYALHDAQLVVHAVPVQFSRRALQKVAQYIPPHVPVLSTSKGIETGTLSMMTEIIGETCGEDTPIAVLSGPSFAKEMALGLATAVVVGSEDYDVARKIAKGISHETFRCFVSRDVLGLEIGGAVKNVIALAAGTFRAPDEYNHPNSMHRDVRRFRPWDKCYGGISY